MTQTKHQVEYSAMVSAEQAAGYLESVAAGIRRHAMLVESGSDSIALDIGEMMKLEAQFNTNEKKSKIEVGLSWRPVAAPLVPPSLNVLTADDLAGNGYGNLLPRSLGKRSGSADADGSAPSASQAVSAHTVADDVSPPTRRAKRAASSESVKQSATRTTANARGKRAKK